MSTVEETVGSNDTAELPRISGLYLAEDLDGGHPVHVDDAFGWVVECFGRAFLIRRDEATGRHTFASFRSLERIVELFGRIEPLGVLGPEAPAHWPARLTTDNDAFALSTDELLALAAELTEAGRVPDKTI